MTKRKPTRPSSISPFGEMAADFETLATILNGAGASRDVSSLYAVAAKLRSIEHSGKAEYDYAEILPLEAPIPKKVRPQGIRRIELSLEVCVCASFTADDPFSVLEVQILMYGNKESQSRRHVSAWHVDRHQDGDGEPKEVHPRYHIQFGGRQIKGSFEDEDFGSILVPDAPRIPLPPLDLALAVDFALSNFNGPVWHQLREDPEYLEVMRRAQARYWLPYFRALTGGWAMPAGSTAWACNDVLPNIVRGL